MAQTFQILQSNAVTVGATSQQLLAANPNRKHFSIQNQGAQSVYIHFGTEDATTTNGVEVKVDVLYEPFFPGRGEIHAISASGDQACVVTEG